MPFLRDEGPPIPQATIQKLRESLPVDYGWQIVNETGREVLVVRVPKAKPDYLHDLAEVAFYVGLEQIRNTKDVLLVGHEKTARLEPQLLRDHIRAQAREDDGVVDHLRRQLDRQYGHTFLQSPGNHQHNAFAVRIPKESVAQFTPEDVSAIRQLVANLRPRVMECQYALIVANMDHERLGRRTLLELIGEAPAVAAPPTPPSPAPPTAAPAPRPAFPAASPFAPAPATTAAVAPAAAPVAAVAPPPAIAAPEPVAVEAPVVEAHEEYEIVSKPKAPAPVEAAPAAPAHHRLGLEGAEVVHDEYEIVSKPKAPVSEAPPPPPSPLPSEAHKVLREDKEFEVFTSKPKPRDDSKPAITPPGMGGFQAALHGAAGPAPTRTKEYEVIGRTSVTSDPSIMSRMKLPSASGPAPAASPIMAAAQPAAPPPVAMTQAAVPLPPKVATPVAPADSGAPIVARVAPAAPELVLSARFKEAGYEVVEGLKAQGTQFVFAAHKPNGRRVLVRRTEAFAAEDAATLAQLVSALGADVALVIADTVKPGTRLATWGTRIEVVTPADVPALSF